MKTIFNKNASLIALVALVGLLSGCKKEFLEVEPRGRLIASNVSDYDLLLNSTALLNQSATGPVLLGDEIADIDPFFTGSALRTQRFYRWEGEVYLRDEDAQEMTTYNQNLYTYNKIILEVMDAKNGTEQQKKAIRGEALMGRAWTNFMLVNMYGMPYTQAAAATDLAYPLIVDASVTKTNFTRATVKEMYDLIIEDLTTAINDLPPNMTHRLRASKPAAQALLGKVYVFMGRFSDALPLLNSAISSLGSSALPARLYNYNVSFATGGNFLPISSLGPAYPTIPNNEETLYGKQLASPWTFTANEILLNPQTVALFAANDLRLKFFRPNPAPSGANHPLGMLKRMGPIATPFGVIIPDMYLLRAECKARTNDLPGAVADLEFLRKNRMPEASAGVPAAVQSNRDALVMFVIEERIREFALLGFRWFDMRRLSVDQLFGQKTFVHNVYAADGTVTNTYTSSPERLVLQLPLKVLDQNPGMPNNP